MKTAFMGLMIFALTESLMWGASNTRMLFELLDQAIPVDAETYHMGLQKLAAVEDTSGMQQYLYSAYWERAPIVSHTASAGAIIGVMRTSSAADAEKIFNRGLMFASVGVKGHGKWSTNRKIAEFGYPRILMRFGDVLVAFQDFGPLSEGEKSSLIAEFENAVQEWRKRGAEAKAFETPITELLAPPPAKLSQELNTNSIAVSVTEARPAQAPAKKAIMFGWIVALGILAAIGALVARKKKIKL